MPLAAQDGDTPGTPGHGGRTLPGRERGDGVPLAAQGGDTVAGAWGRTLPGKGRTGPPQADFS